jgi:3'-5' exoribonuclease
MARRCVQQLADGDALEEVFLISDKQVRANRNGSPYLQVDLRDRTGFINAKLWNATDAIVRGFECGDFVRARGKVQLFNGALQVILTHIDRIDSGSVELGEFLPHTEQDVGRLLQKLTDSLRTLSNPHLRALAESFLMDDGFMAAFRQCPAGVRNHHAYVGGLLEHVVNLLDGADRLAPLYPAVDRDLLLIGVFLHDCGKVRELSFRRTFAYTDEGQLLGHLVLGVEMLNEKVRQASSLTGEAFPGELLLRIKHMILSHHGQLEFGSPVVPMTPEAILLASLDNLDAKVHTFTRDIREDRNTSSSWTPYNQSLGRRLFKTSAGGNGGMTPDGE